MLLSVSRRRHLAFFLPACSSLPTPKITFQSNCAYSHPLSHKRAKHFRHASASRVITARSFCSAAPDPHRRAAGDNDVDVPSEENTHRVNDSNSSSNPVESESDLQIHLDFLRNECSRQQQEQEQWELEGGELSEARRDLEQLRALVYQLQHPLLRKYDFDSTQFIIGATDAIHHLFQAMQESADRRGLGGPHEHGDGGGSRRDSRPFSPEVVELLGETCSESATEVLRQVMAGELAIDDLHDRKKHDLKWFSKFGLGMEHTLHVRERRLAFAQLDSVLLHVSRSRSPAEEGEEEEEGAPGDDKRHVLAEVNTTYQLRSDTTLSYFLLEPRYDLRDLKEDSLALLHVRFTGCLSDGEELEWRISRVSVTQVWPPSITALIKKLFFS